MIYQCGVNSHNLWGILNKSMDTMRPFAEDFFGGIRQREHGRAHAQQHARRLSQSTIATTHAHSHTRHVPLVLNTPNK